MSAADGIAGARRPDYGATGSADMRQNLEDDRVQRAVRHPFGAIGLLVVGGVLAFGASVCRALDECSSAQTARLVSISVPIALGGIVGIARGYWRGSTPTKANPGVV